MRPATAYGRSAPSPRCPERSEGIRTRSGRTSPHMFRMRSAAVLVIVLLGTAGPLLGRTSADQAAERPPGEAEMPAPERMPVEIDGDVLFYVRGVSSYPAERRAQDLETRIVGLAKDRS